MSEFGNAPWQIYVYFAYGVVLFATLGFGWVSARHLSRVSKELREELESSDKSKRGEHP
jgi:hypothetical protein